MRQRSSPYSEGVTVHEENPKQAQLRAA